MSAPKWKIATVCGCAAADNGQIDYCPMHAAAPAGQALRDAAHALLLALNAVDLDEATVARCRSVDDAIDAWDAAKGESK